MLASPDALPDTTVLASRVDHENALSRLLSLPLSRSQLPYVTCMTICISLSPFISLSRSFHISCHRALSHSLACRHALSHSLALALARRGFWVVVCTHVRISIHDAHVQQELSLCTHHAHAVGDKRCRRRVTNSSRTERNGNSPRIDHRTGTRRREVIIS